MKAFFLLFVTFFSVFVPSLSGAVTFSTVTGVTLADHSPSVGSNEMSYTAGFLTEFRTSGLLGVETGALYVLRRRATNYRLMEEYYVHAPLGLRFHFGPVMSLYGGMYYARNFRSGNSDYGSSFAIAWAMPLESNFIVSLEARYLLGMKELVLPAAAKTRDIYLLLGIQFATDIKY